MKLDAQDLEALKQAAQFEAVDGGVCSIAPTQLLDLIALAETGLEADALSETVSYLEFELEAAQDEVRDLEDELRVLTEDAAE